MRSSYNFAFRYFRISYLPYIILVLQMPLILGEGFVYGWECSGKQLRWYNIALMSFITVWGFGNVVNNYANQAGGCFFILSLRLISHLMR